MYVPVAAAAGTCQVTAYERCCPAVNAWLSNQTWCASVAPSGASISTSTSAFVAVALVTVATRLTALPVESDPGVADPASVKLGPGTGVAVGALVGAVVGVAV